MKRMLPILLIFILAFVLRFYKISEVPPSLNWDEVSIGYNAYSILKTGKDEWGKFLPLHFRSYGEYKLPAQVYASIPGISIFGLNELGVRITPVVYGTLTVLFLYFLAKELFKNEAIGLLSAFLLGVSTWHIHLTRASFESSFSVLWIVMGIWFIVLGFRNPRWWILSIIPFAVSVYTYNTARVFTPLFLLTIFIIFRKNFWLHKKETIFSILLFILFMLPLIPFVLSGEAKARYKLVSITDDPGLIPRINERRGASSFPPPLPRLIHNKVTYVGYYFFRNYLEHFTPDFLFVSGAPHKQHHVQNIGELYAFQGPFLILGIYLLFKKKKRFRWLLASWVLLAFVPVSTTNDSIPNALRTLISTPAYQILTAYGIFFALLWLKNKKKIWRISLGLASIFIVGISLSGYLNRYFRVYPKLYSRDWQYGYKQVVEFIKENYDKYDLIVFSRHYGEPHMFTLFFMNWEPAKFINDPNLVRFETFDWVRVLRFDKFYFPDLGDKGTQFEDIRQENPDKKMLFIGKKGDFPDNLPRLLTVDFLNGDRAFEAVETK